ncbi:TonB-dependent receptor [Polaribacter cellanae]|uniref:TonB-dependent receptor n=1 Tax=Polaribacter cellanae TaxID=2818493 RepID=A0A975CQ37_9FLAO|nr:TonB-dependent receptor [Polaribacter cellanae]QTE23275.1 TonB-dependent receptor [Polaribacter cellanae]
MKNLLLTLALSLLTNLAFAQNATITGTISDSNGSPISSVNVIIKNTSKGTITNENGKYTFKNLDNGKITIVASLIGFTTVEKRIRLTNNVQVVNFTLKESAEGLDEVIIVGEREVGYVAKKQTAATFGSRNLVDIPQSVSVITQEVLLDQQVRALGDLVRNDPSIIVSNPPGFNETINVRGYNLDNSSSYRRENLIFQNQVQSPFENKAAVEIVKGPAAIRYGFTPPGGIINYVLKRPTAKPYIFIQGFGDSNGTVGIHGDFGGTINETFGYRINALVSEEASFVNDVSGPRQMFSALFEWKPSEKLTIDFEGEYQYRELEQQATIRLNSFDSKLSIAQRKQLLEDFDPKTFIGQKWGTYPTRNFVGSIGVTYNFNDNWKVQGRIQKMNLIRDQKAAGIVNGTLQANGDFKSQIYFSPSQVRDPLSTEVFLTGKFNTFSLEHNIAVGTAYSRNPLSFSTTNARFTAGSSNIFNPIDLPYPNATAGPTVEALIFTQKAAYITDFIKISDKIEILAAVRYTEQKNEDVFNDSKTLKESYKDNILSPNIGVIYKPTEDISLYGSYATGVTNGLQIPTEADNFGNDIFLDPVETEQFEFGAKVELFKKALLTAAVFDIDQPLAFIDNNNIFRYGGSQRHRGAEFTLSGKVTNDLKLVVGGLYLDAQIDNETEPKLDGKRPASVPEFQGNIYADYKLSFVEGLSTNVGIFYTGDRFADNLETFEVDGYVRLDLGAKYDFNIMGTEMTARANIRNLTNNQFIEGLAFGSFLYGAPTTAIFSLAAKF